jgi:hypothetical protein
LVVQARAIQVPQIAELAEIRINNAITTSVPPRAVCFTTAVSVVAVWPQAAGRDRHRPIAAVALLSSPDDPVTAAVKQVVFVPTRHATIEVAGATNLGAGSS